MKENNIMSAEAFEAFEKEYQQALQKKKANRITEQRTRVKNAIKMAQDNWLNDPIGYEGKKFTCSVEFDEEMTTEIQTELEEAGWYASPYAYAHSGDNIYIIRRASACDEMTIYDEMTMRG